MDINKMFSPRAVDGMYARLKTVADELGVPLGRHDHAPSTKPALALSEYARRRGKLDEWRTLGMDAYWEHGLDIENRDVLRDLLVQTELDADDALAWLDNPEVKTLLQEQRQEAARWGVTGIPTWFMLPAGWKPGDDFDKEGPRPMRIVGCQPASVVEQVAQLAGATPRVHPA